MASIRAPLSSYVCESAILGTTVRRRVLVARQGRCSGMMDLKRAKRDRWLMGVCGGIAHRYGWNSTMVRLVTIIVAIVIPGVSVIPTLLIYFLLGYLLPEADEF
jgi:phage shock protein C